MAATIKAFVNLSKEENPDAKEEDIDPEEKDTKNTELDKVRILKEK